MNFCRLTAVVLLLTMVSSNTVHGQSVGRWHVPSTLPQFCGYGYGPGHHAPMIRVPGYRPMQIQRMTIGCASRPPLCTMASYGCASSGCLESLPARDSCGPQCYGSQCQVNSTIPVDVGALFASPPKDEQVLTPRPSGESSLATPPMPTAE